MQLRLLIIKFSNTYQTTKQHLAVRQDPEHRLRLPSRLRIAHLSCRHPSCHHPCPFSLSWHRCVCAPTTTASTTTATTTTTHYLKTGSSSSRQRKREGQPDFARFFLFCWLGFLPAKSDYTWFLFAASCYITLETFLGLPTFLLLILDSNADLVARSSYSPAGFFTYT